MKNKKIIIAGGTGFIGQALAKYFGKENRIIILTRGNVDHSSNNYNSTILSDKDGYDITYLSWNGRTVDEHWAKEINGADIVLNLAGKSVNCRYSQKNMKKVFDSRTHATEVIAEAINRSAVPPKLWINAASATIYCNSFTPQDDLGGKISEEKNDNMPFSLLDRIRRRYRKFFTSLRYGKASEEYKLVSKDFSVLVCKKWEKTFFEQQTSTRKVALRMAITLGEAGVIVPYFNLLKFALGGHQGNGKQMYSWVHVEDVARSIEWIYDHEDMQGVYNCSSPNPVTNKDFMSTLRKITGHIIGLPAFTMMLEFGAAMIGTETELILKSRCVVPAKLLQSGFQFKYLLLKDALQQIVDQTPRKKYHLF